MYLGSDAIALAPFTDTISYLEDGDWAVLTRKGVADPRRTGPQGRARGSSSPRHRRSWSTKATTSISWRRKSTSSPKWSATRSRITSTWSNERVALPDALPFDWKNLKRLSISACGTAFYAGLVAKYWFERFAQAAGRDRCRLRIPLPRRAARSRAISHVHLAVGRDRRHAGDAALRQREQAARSVGRQRADLDHRARKRRRHADARRARRSASPRPRPSPASSARWPALRSRPAARAACCRQPTSRSSCMR